MTDTNTATDEPDVEARVTAVLDGDADKMGQWAVDLREAMAEDDLTDATEDDLLLLVTALEDGDTSEAAIRIEHYLETSDLGDATRALLESWTGDPSQLVDDEDEETDDAEKVEASYVGLARKLQSPTAVQKITAALSEPTPPVVRRRGDLGL